MSIFQMNANDIANAQGRSPAWLFDGDLMTGKVPSGCQMRPSMPGIPLMCNPVHPEFLSVINDLLFMNPASAAYPFLFAIRRKSTMQNIIHVLNGRLNPNI